MPSSLLNQGLTLTISGVIRPRPLYAFMALTSTILRYILYAVWSNIPTDLYLNKFIILIRKNDR